MYPVHVGLLLMFIRKTKATLFTNAGAFYHQVSILDVLVQQKTARGHEMALWATHKLLKVLRLHVMNLLFCTLELEAAITDKTFSFVIRYV